MTAVVRCQKPNEKSDERLENGLVCGIFRSRQQKSAEFTLFERQFQRAISDCAKVAISTIEIAL